MFNIKIFISLVAVNGFKVNVLVNVTFSRGYWMFLLKLPTFENVYLALMKVWFLFIFNPTNLLFLP